MTDASVATKLTDGSFSVCSVCMVHKKLFLLKTVKSQHLFLAHITMHSTSDFVVAEKVTKVVLVVSMFVLL